VPPAEDGGSRFAKLKTRALDLRGRVLSQLAMLHVEAEHPLVRECSEQPPNCSLAEENAERELAICATFALSPTAVR